VIVELGDVGVFVAVMIVREWRLNVLGQIEEKCEQRVVAGDGLVVRPGGRRIDADVDSLVRLINRPALRDAGNVVAGVRMRHHPGHAVEAADPRARGEVRIRPGEAQCGREVFDGFVVGATFGGFRRPDLGLVHAGLPHQIGGQIGGRGEGEQVGARRVEIQHFLSIVESGVRRAFLLGTAAGTEQRRHYQQQALPAMSSCHAMFSRMQDVYL
jgi:hypothetical protein